VTLDAPARYLIVNADDLGASAGVNRGILEGCARGVVTSASMMVDRPGSEDAGGALPDTRRLGVGLHVTLTSEAGDLAIETAACRAELERQLARFEDLTGRRPTHIDSHHNIHRDARLREEFASFAAGLDLPLREHSPARYFSSFYGQWDGETHLEQIGVESLEQMLASEIRPGVTELGCHPGYVDHDFASSYGHEREAELRTLCDPAIRTRVEALGIRLVNFADLPELAHEQLV
jgi:chitin disaccharide deacetylase